MGSDTTLTDALVRKYTRTVPIVRAEEIGNFLVKFSPDTTCWIISDATLGDPGALAFFPLSCSISSGRPSGVLAKTGGVLR